jgi:hypothetical protein
MLYNLCFLWEYVQILINKHNGWRYQNLFQHFLPFMDSEGSLPYQKVPATGLYCEVRKPTQHRQTLL